MRSPSHEATLNLPSQRLLSFSGRLSNHHLAAAVRDFEFSGSVVCVLGAFFSPPCESFALSALVATAERKRRIKVRVNQPQKKRKSPFGVVLGSAEQFESPSSRLHLIVFRSFLEAQKHVAA